MQLPRQRRTFWQWYRAQTKFSRIGLGCASIFAILLLCTCSLAAFGSTLPPPPKQTAASSPTAALIATATQPLRPTATTPKPILTQTPTPRSQPTQPPTATPVRTGVNGNPWGYDFNPGNLISYPPSNFCSYFNCIASFYGSDDPGDGYIIECVDGTYSQSGGERGACSSHGGESRPLYSH